MEKYYRLRVSANARLLCFNNGMPFRDTYFIDAVLKDGKFVTHKAGIVTPDFKVEEIPEEFIIEKISVAGNR